MRYGVSCVGGKQVWRCAGAGFGAGKTSGRLPRLHIKGLMTIGLFSAEAEKVRVCFKKLRQIQQEIKVPDISGLSMDDLYMGMSGDLGIAVAEDATIVRVGTAILVRENTRIVIIEKNSYPEPG